MTTAAEIKREIARLRQQLRDWELMAPCGDAEIEINDQIADLRDDLNEIEETV